MDNEVARRLAETVLADVVRAGHAELTQRLDQTTHERLIGNDGREYQVETTVFWDDPKAQSIRVIVSVDDGGWRAFVPLSVSDIVEATPR